MAWQLPFDPHGSCNNNNSNNNCPRAPNNLERTEYANRLQQIFQRYDQSKGIIGNIRHLVLTYGVSLSALHDLYVNVCKQYGVPPQNVFVSNSNTNEMNQNNNNNNNNNNTHNRNNPLHSFSNNNTNIINNNTNHWWIDPFHSFSNNNSNDISPSKTPPPPAHQLIKHKATNKQCTITTPQLQCIDDQKIDTNVLYQQLEIMQWKIKHLEKQNVMIQTEVVWEWKAGKKWHPYNSNISSKIETLSANEKYRYKCKQNGQTYTITKLSNNTARQINEKTMMRRSVRKNTYINDGKTKNVNNDGKTKKNETYPWYWNKSISNDHKNYAKGILITCLQLQLEDNDYDNVRKIFNLFYKTMKNKFKIVGIDGVQNRLLWYKYYTAKKILIRLIGKNNMNERYLFHGTKQDVINTIINQGFRKEFTSKALYGEGTYFARDAKYSSKYAPEINGIYKIVLCKVLCGEMCKGGSGVKLRDWPKKHDGLQIYDSLVDDLRKPSIFVIHDDVRAYPMNIIHFKKLEPLW